MTSLWSRLGYLVSCTVVQTFSKIVEGVRTLFEGDVETRRQVAFSVAMIALSAKIAKADGVVTDAEIKAFYEIFSVPPREIRHVEQLYNIAKKDIAGFEHYARNLYQLCCETGCDSQLLEDVLEGLFHITKADGMVHEDELRFLSTVAELFSFSRERFENIAARHVNNGESDPWYVLGLKRGVGHEAARKRYRELVREHHPDRVLARGLPKEFLAIATARMAAINAAWATIQGELVTL